MGEATNPVHPGEILAVEFLAPLRLTAQQAAAAAGIPPQRLAAIVAGDRPVTASDALRLARYFGTSDKFWLHLQVGYDLGVTRPQIAADLDAIAPLASPPTPG